MVREALVKQGANCLKLEKKLKNANAHSVHPGAIPAHKMVNKKKTSAVCQLKREKLKHNAIQMEDENEREEKWFSRKRNEFKEKDSLSNKNMVH